MASALLGVTGSLGRRAAPSDRRSELYQRSMTEMRRPRPAPSRSMPHPVETWLRDGPAACLPTMCPTTRSVNGVEPGHARGGAAIDGVDCRRLAPHREAP